MAFLEAVKADTSLEDKLKKAADADAVVAIAKEMGFVISVESLESFTKAEAELSEEELEALAGGAPAESGWGTSCSKIICGGC